MFGQSSPKMLDEVPPMWSKFLLITYIRKRMFYFIFMRSTWIIMMIGWRCLQTTTSLCWWSQCDRTVSRSMHVNQTYLFGLSSPRHPTRNTRLTWTLIIFRLLYILVMCLSWPFSTSLLPSISTINHHILFHRLQSLYSSSGTVPLWFESYLAGRTQTMTVVG